MMKKKTDPLVPPKQCSWLFTFCEAEDISEEKMKDKMSGVSIFGEITKGLKDFDDALKLASQHQELGHITSLLTSPLKEWKAYLDYFFHYAPNIQSLDELIMFQEIQFHNIRELTPEEEKFCEDTGTPRTRGGCEADLEKKILYFYGTPWAHGYLRRVVATALMATETFEGMDNEYYPPIRRIPKNHTPLYRLFFEGTDKNELLDLEEV